VFLNVILFRLIRTTNVHPVQSYIFFMNPPNCFDSAVLSFRQGINILNILKPVKLINILHIDFIQVAAA